MVRDAYTFLIPLGILGAICLLLGWMFVPPLLIIGGIRFFLAAFVAFFFRNPQRDTLVDEKIVVSPADGLIVVLKLADGKDASAGTLISGFLGKVSE